MNSQKNDTLSVTVYFFMNGTRYSFLKTFK